MQGQPSSTYSVRSALEADGRSICEVERACFPDPYPSAFLDYLIKTEREHFFVGVRDGTIVGYAVATATNKHGHLVSIAVDPFFRKLGIGTQLLCAVTQALRKEEIEEIHLEVRKGNKTAIIFYEKNGFKIFSEIERYYSNGEDALVLTRRLASSDLSTPHTAMTYP